VRAVKASASALIPKRRMVSPFDRGQSPDDENSWAPQDTPFMRELSRLSNVRLLGIF